MNNLIIALIAILIIGTLFVIKSFRSVNLNCVLAKLFQCEDHLIRL